MNRALLFGAMMGARTCAPAMEIISDTARSNIPAGLGLCGHVLLTLQSHGMASCPDAGRDNHRHGMAGLG